MILDLLKGWTLLRPGRARAEGVPGARPSRPLQAAKRRRRLQSKRSAEVHQLAFTSDVAAPEAGARRGRVALS